MTTTRLLDEAVKYHQAGRLDEAAELYNQILALPLHPDEADALHLMGVLFNQKGDSDKAREMIGRAIALRPASDLFRVNLGTILAFSGLHTEAAEHFRKAISLNPKSPPSILTSLGQSLAAMGQMPEAVDAFEWAVKRNPSAETLVLLGESLLRAGRLPEAVDRLNDAIRLQPGFAEAHGALGLVHEKQGQLDESEYAYRVAIALKPGLAEARNNLADVYALRGRWSQAVAELRQAIDLQPNVYQSHFNLANALQMQGKNDEAIECWRKVVELKADIPQAWERLGDLLLARRDFAEAAGCFRKAIAIQPGFLLYTKLGSALGANDEMDEAMTAHQKAIELRPNDADARVALGAALRWCGRVDEEINQFKRAISLDPKNHIAHSHLLYSMLFHGEFSREEIFAEHVKWGEQHTGQIIPLPPPANDASPARRLKIGYVSPNFRNQAVMSFVLPIVEHRDPWEVEVFCYSDVRAPDGWTRRLHEAADEWRDTADLSFEELANVIRKDSIDILIDLTGHIGNGRLQTFAYKPAPVQVSYIGYQATTGVPSIDYFLTDDQANPPGQSDACFVEQLARLPDSFFCYTPPPEAPPIGPLPVDANGWVTFGCLNNLAKVNQKTIHLWSRVLLKLENSRFMLLTPNSQKVRDRLLAEFQTHGISPDRMEFVNRASPEEYLRRYNRIDIALDPMPFNGHTTTCDGAWMGCPTVMLAGDSYASRYGGSVNRNIGLEDLIAGTEDQYARIARALADDRDRLRQLKASLRQRMRDSIVTSGPMFTHQLEQTFRSLWAMWCARRTR